VGRAHDGFVDHIANAKISIESAPQNLIVEHSPMHMTNNTIIITGGGSGIGRGLAEKFHANGNQVIIAGRNQGRLDEVAAANPGMVGIALDIADAASIKAFAARIIAEYPAANVLINNAGMMVAEAMTADPVDVQVAEDTVTTNMRAVAAFARTATGDIDDGDVWPGLRAAGDDAGLLRDEGGHPLLVHGGAPPIARHQCSGG
jgi:NAD(P)-dependent dehydrogenase (short-subunit alcohol dehydrogenase family)